jgi:hypothetical protein
VDRALAMFDAAGAQRGEQLADLVRAEEVARQILQPPTPIEFGALPQSPQVFGFLRAGVAGALQGSPLQEHLAAIAASQPHLFLILKLIAGDEPPQGCNAARLALLCQVPAEQFAAFVKLPEISTKYKAEALAHHIREHRQLPPNCDELWNEPSVLACEPGSSSLLVEALRMVSADVRLDLRKHSGNVRKDTFVCNLFAVVRGKDDELLIRILDSLTPDAFSGLAPRLGPRAAQLDMGLQNVLINKAIGLLEQLHNEPEEFRERLATLEAISAVLEGKPANRLMNWCKIVGTLEAADREFRSQQGMLKKLSLEMALMNRKLHPAFEVVYLMPDERYTYVSSSLVKEIARLKGQIAELVPAEVAEAVAKKLEAVS